MTHRGTDYKKLYEVKAITGRGSIAVGPFTDTHIRIDMDKVDGLQKRFKMMFREIMDKKDILNAEKVIASSDYVSDSAGWVWTFSVWSLSASLPQASIDRYKRYLHDCIAMAEIEFDLDLITQYDNDSPTWEEMNDDE